MASEKICRDLQLTFTNKNKIWLMFFTPRGRTSWKRPLPPKRNDVFPVRYVVMVLHCSPKQAQGVFRAARELKLLGKRSRPHRHRVSYDPRSQNPEGLPHGSTASQTLPHCSAQGPLTRRFYPSRPVGGKAQMGRRFEKHIMLVGTRQQPTWVCEQLLQVSIWIQPFDTTDG